MDPKKVQAIEEWRPPSDVHDLRSFLGWRTTRRFEGLLRDSTAHDGLIKEDGDLGLDAPMPSSLRQLKESDGDRSCVGLTRYVETVHGETDASDFALGGS
ncbi:UNVERIFIED_CONTAM: hypothetical protein Sangu_2620900 [Sesamum angustifolium]|uniref:Uncharacterized protein n=1 Tax=Sesamum angustifolium TaxID=2727405 RepID=A0AAW2J585_9LAMI